MREARAEHEGLTYARHPDVYDPSDDTFLLLSAVTARPPGRLLEVGTGTGLVAIAAARAGHRTSATDLHPNALRLTARNVQKNNVRVDVVRADLLSGVRPERFDLIAFNPPYLPTAPAERVPGPLNDAFDGGPSGRRIVERFLSQLPRSGPPVLLVVTSLQEPRALERSFRSAGRRARTVAARRFEREEIRVELLESEESTRRAQKD